MKFKVLQENLRKTLWHRIEEEGLTGLRLAEQTGFKQAHISNFLNRKWGLSLEGMDKVLRVQHLSVLDLLDPDEVNKRASILPPSEDEFQNVLVVDGAIAANEPLVMSMSSAFISDAKAEDELLSSLEGKPLSDPLKLRFSTGRRKAFWNKNCVAIGLSAGFLEPLESTSIHLIHRGIAVLLKFFPDRHFKAADIERYNKIFTFEYERIRDFLLLHYCMTEREDGEIWRHCRSIALPDTLLEKIALFRSYGRILREDTELFPVQSWLYVFVGQNIMPDGYDPLADTLDPLAIETNLNDIRAVTRQCAEAMPLHQDFIKQYCSALSEPA